MIEQASLAKPNFHTFNVHGFCFQIVGPESTSAGLLAGDFEFFRCDAAVCELRVELHTTEPPYADTPGEVATNYTPRNVSFTVGDTTWLDYGGRALAVRNREEGTFHVYSLYLDLQYEAGYLFLLSQIGEALDQLGMHRIHAMALSYRGQAVLAVMPMGGGKSTLCCSLFKFPEFRFLSDDSPIINRDGQVLSFPLRLGLVPGYDGDIPPEHKHTIQRVEFGPKVVVNFTYFAHRVQKSSSPGIVFLARRSLRSDCLIQQAGFLDRYRSIVADCVVGLGLFQGIEFLLRRSPLEILGKIGVAWSRLRAARTLFRRSEVYCLVLGRDTARNADTVFRFVQDRLGDAGQRNQKKASESLPVSRR
jgi:hypothetical protein